MTYRWLTAVALGPAALAISSASASWLSSADLDRHCSAYLSDPFSTEAAVCAAFVQGYVSAAGSTAKGTHDGAEGFAERAARTRIGSRLRSVREEHALPREYCLEDALPAAVVEAVAAHLSRVEWSADAAPEHRVHRALVAQFPCDSPDP